MSEGELSTVVSLLQGENLNPKRAFGQNFLVDEGKIESIVRILDAENCGTTVEIGPGLGALTIPLSRKARKLIAVEADRDMVKLLEKRVGEGRDFEIVNSPFEHWTPAGIEEDLLLVGNLPYNLTSKLLEKAVQCGAKTLGFMVQREVADKLDYHVGSSDCNALACYISLLGKITDRIDVARGCFYPTPKVDSSFIRVDIVNEVPFTAYRGLKKLFNTPNKKLSTVISMAIPDKEARSSILERFSDITDMRARQLEPEKLLPLAIAVEECSQKSSMISTIGRKTE